MGKTNRNMAAYREFLNRHGGVSGKGSKMDVTGEESEGELLRRFGPGWYKNEADRNRLMGVASRDLGARYIQDAVEEPGYNADMARHFAYARHEAGIPHKSYATNVERKKGRLDK